MRRPLLLRRFFRALPASPSSSTRVASSADLFEGTLKEGGTTTQDEDLSSKAQGVRRDYTFTRSCDDATEEMDGGDARRRRMAEKDGGEKDFSTN